VAALREALDQGVLVLNGSSLVSGLLLGSGRRDTRLTAIYPVGG
jgi:hypothetical protein